MSTSQPQTSFRPPSTPRGRPLTQAAIRRNRHAMPIAQYRKNLATLLDIALSDPTYQRPWYAEIHSVCKDLAAAYNVPFPQVVGIVAALSPGADPQSNLSYAEEVLDTGDTSGHPYGDAITKAREILSGRRHPSDLGTNAPKTRSFAHNIARPYATGHVTVDRHIVSAATYGIPTVAQLSANMRRTLTLTDAQLKDRLQKRGQYILIAGIILSLARERGIAGSRAQELIWSVWRTNYALTSKRDLPVPERF